MAKQKKQTTPKIDIEIEKRKARDAGFIEGVLYAAQQIAICADEPTIAVDYILHESGLSREELLNAQYTSDFYTDDMVELIAQATQEEGAPDGDDS